VKGKRLQLQCSELITNRVCVCCHLPTKKFQVSSYYPGRGDHSHVLARLDHANRDMFHSPAVDDDCTETEEDQTDDKDEDTVKNTHKHPTKFLESMLLERPSWVEQAGAQPASDNYSAIYDSGVPTSGISVATRHPNPNIGSADIVSDLPEGAWPAETDLVFNTGSSRLMLTIQRPLVRSIIQDAIENLWAALLFNNAFPDVCLALSLIKDCLFTAADLHKPAATDILERLKRDGDYLLKITPLPRARICLIRSEVKERCNVITMGAFLAFGLPSDITGYVRVGPRNPGGLRR
jgi:hypothetical protein